MYKYQEEIIEEIEDAVEKLEEMTEERYRLHIGWRHTNDFDEENIPIYLEINGNSIFRQRTNSDYLHDWYSRCELRNYNRIELNKDIFLDLNKLLDEIIKDNKKREEFYENLNKELSAFNKCLNKL